MASLMLEAFLLYYSCGYSSMVYLKQNAQHNAVLSPTCGWMIFDVDPRLKNSIQWMVRQFVCMHTLLNYMDSGGEFYVKIPLDNLLRYTESLCEGSMTTYYLEVFPDSDGS